MSTLALRVDLQFETVSCFSCAQVFAMPLEFYRNRRRDHEQFYCPNGHRQYFTGKSDLEEAQEQLANTQKQLRWARDAQVRLQEQADRNDRRRIAMQGVATRRANELTKVKGGICPCCTKELADLKRHMARQHPHFEPGREQHVLELEMNTEEVK